MCHAPERLNDSVVTLMSEEKRDEGQPGVRRGEKSKCISPLLLAANGFLQFVVICYQIDQHKLHNGICFRHKHDQCPRGERCCPLHSPMVYTLLASSSKQAPNQRRQIAWENLTLCYQPVSGPKPIRVLGPVVGTEIRKPVTKIELCFF